MSIAPDGRTAISASWDKTLKVWDVESGQLLRTLEGHQEGVLAVSIAPDGKTAVSASYDKTLKLWDLATGACLASSTADGSLHCAALTADGRRVVAGDALGRLHFLDLILPGDRGAEPPPVSELSPATLPPRSKPTWLRRIFHRF